METVRDPEQRLLDVPAGEASGRFHAVYEIGRSLLEQTAPGRVIETIQQSLKGPGSGPGNKRRAIELLQISSETFYRRLRDLGLKE